MNDELKSGMDLLDELARKFSRAHGLQVKEISWAPLTGDIYVQHVEAGDHSLKLSFSVDEIEAYAGREGTEFTKQKVRNAFAGLTL